jgi:hypothetical protein
MPTLVASLTEDASVLSDVPGSNYGTDNWVYVGTISGSLRRGFFKWDLTGLPAGARVTSAIWHAYQFVAVQGDMSAQPASASWSEGTVTWTSQPGVTGTAVTVPMSSFGLSFQDYDITDLVAQWAQGGRTNYGARFKASNEAGTAGMQFGSSEGSGSADTLTITYTLPHPPNGPIGLYPDTTAPLNRSATNRFSWTFSDDDPGDVQSGFDLRYGPTGTAVGTWTTVSGSTPNSFYDFPAGTFAAGNFEWQVRTHDALDTGGGGAWSASAFFTAANAPAGASITSPVNGATISSPNHLFEWTTSSQDAYEVRTVADVLGAPDTTSIFYTTGIVADPTARAVLLPYPTNSIYVHSQINRRISGLWSGWVSVRNPVSYTQPAAPSVEAISNSPAGAVTVVATHPTPTGDQPAVSEMDVWRRSLIGEGRYDLLQGGVDGKQMVNGTGVSPAAEYWDWETAGSLLGFPQYGYAVLARAANGTTRMSGWTDETSVPGGTTDDGLGGYPDGFDGGY